MSNPARELHEIYTGWRERAAARGGAMREVVQPDSAEGNAQLLRVFGLLTRIDALLLRLEREGQSVAVYRRQFPAWSYGAIGRHVGWTTQVKAENVMTANHMDQIEAFASFLDGKVVVLDEHGEQTLRSALQRARVLLEEDTGLDQQLRVYISRLLHEIQTALDDDALWARADIEDRAWAFWSAMRAAESASPAKGSAWRDIWVQFAASAGANVVTQATFLGITGGFVG